MFDGTQDHDFFHSFELNENYHIEDNKLFIYCKDTAELTINSNNIICDLSNNDMIEYSSSDNDDLSDKVECLPLTAM